MSRQAAYALGRVSVIRGEVSCRQPGPVNELLQWCDGQGEMIGVPCIDDYIATREHVEDYLTRFSGLQAGDLDPGLSRHHLLPLKSVYKKLALMVSKGIVFIGHGAPLPVNTFLLLTAS